MFKAGALSPLSGSCGARQTTLSRLGRQRQKRLHTRKMKKNSLPLLPRKSGAGSSPFTEDEDVTTSSEAVAEA